MASTLSYSKEGEGFPVIFLHGFLENSTMWENLSRIDGIEAICIDLPGHGESNEVTDFSMRAVAQQIIALLNQLNLDRYHIVGHSMGGYIGLEILNSDSRAEKLVLLNSNFWTDDEEKKENRRRMASVVRKNKNLFLYEAIPNLFFQPQQFDEEVKQLIDSAKHISSSTIAEYSIAMSKRAKFNDLVQLRQSDILVLQGENDAIVESTKMKKATEHFQRLKVISLKGGHMSHIEDSQSCAKLINRFLTNSRND